MSSILTDMKRFVSIFFATLLLSSCKEDVGSGVVTDVETKIAVGGLLDMSVKVQAMFSDTEHFTVQSNKEWFAETDCGWLSLSPSFGEEGVFYEVELRVKSKNLSSASRDGKVMITSGDKTVYISVSQDGYLQTDYGFDDTSASLENHPRLLASGADFTSMRNVVSAHAFLKVIHDYIMRFADRSLSAAPLEYDLKGVRLLNVSIEAFKRLFYLSYAYRITGDSRYALKAEENILTLLEFPDWHPDHFLDCAEIMMGIAIAYDWCYPRLSIATRAAAASALRTKGLEPYFEWPGARNNWNQVCNAAAIYAALAIEEYDTFFCNKVIERAVRLLPVAMAGYSPDGAYVEGPGYWCYGTSYNVLLLDALQRRYGNTKGLLEAYPDFLKTTAYADAMITPSFRVFTYSDQAFPAQVSIVPFYMYNLTGDPSVLYSSNQLLSRSILNYEHCRHERVLPASICFVSRRADELTFADNTPSLEYVAGGQTPVAVFRESWEEGASYLGIKAGSPQTGHGHMDIGTFCFESGGVQWATDLGGENYNALEQAGVDLWNMAQGSERWSVLRCALWGHNCLVFDGREQIVSAYAPYVQENIPNGVTLDLSALYQGQVSLVYRSAWLEGKNAFIRDRIRTSGPVILRWNMCTEASEINIGQGHAVLTSSDGKVLKMEVEGVAGHTMKIWDAAPIRVCETPNTQKFVGFEVALEAEREYEMTIKLIPQK